MSYFKVTKLTSRNEKGYGPRGQGRYSEENELFPQGTELQGAILHL